MNDARRHSQSRYTDTPDGQRAHPLQQGERILVFTEDHGEGLYLLDEPENSLSPARQQGTGCVSGRFGPVFGCQFVLATHSPFFLHCPVQRSTIWTELPLTHGSVDGTGKCAGVPGLFKEHEPDF